MADAIAADLDTIQTLEIDNVGKPVSIIEFEMDLTVDNWRFFAGGARFLEGRAAGEYMEDHTSFLRRDPVGVVASIAPWNYPINMATWKVGPALAAGNTVVLKPSELTPLTALRLAEITADILPPGVLNVVTGQGETAGAALVQHPDVAMVSLTGDVATGKVIARAAADSLKRVHLELGGKAPVIVFDDADVDAVVSTLAEGSYYNSGQDCTAPCRVLAGPKVHDGLVAGLSDAVGGIKTGDPHDPDVAMGPVVSSEQLERVAGFVDRARDAGADVAAGASGSSGGGLLLRAVDRRRRGAGLRDHPARGVRARRHGAAVQRRGRSARAGPTASTTGSPRASGRGTSVAPMKMSALLSFGTVWVNDHIPIVSELPHGGFKQSGYGKDMSIYAIEAYTEIKHVMVKW